MIYVISSAYEYLDVLVDVNISYFEMNTNKKNKIF
jgi:hypothetical protein